MKQRILKGILLSFVVIIFLIGAYLFYNVKIKSSNWYKEKVWNERVREKQGEVVTVKKGKDE